ncbi:MAG: glutathione S-transferase family protein [Alphaproteobacteria bacterium]|nr:glutathione S-transferase family protein [Alphaproteobacteria bacterium]
MSKIDIAYIPIIGRGLQINIIAALHGIETNYLMTKPMGEDFDKDTEAPFGTIPWLKDHSNGIELNDSLAIVQYLVTKYPGPFTPTSTENAALSAMYWSWAQDYYSFVLSPFHDIITGHNEPFWRNLRLTDTLADGGKEKAISNLSFLHKKRLQYLENNIKKMKLSPFVTGEKCSYADIFIYTCIKTVQETKGFSILRYACEGDPFKNCENILNMCNKISDIPEVIETIGSKFKDCPF